jgi:hypothetical protein
MSYVLDDELAAIAPLIPTFDLTDVEGTLETAPLWRAEYSPILLPRQGRTT